MGGSSAAKGTAAALKAFAAAVKLAEEEGLKNCNIPQILKIGQPYANLGNYTFHQIITIIAGIATILTCIIACTVAIGHLVYYVKPHEQKQLLRVIFTLPVFALFSLFGCWFYQAAPYLQPLPQIWEAFGIVAIFYFYVNCVTPKKDIREAFYDGLERQKSFQKTVKHENGSLRWFHLIWICVFQVCLGRIGTTIAYEYLEATLCPLDPRLARRTTAITIVQSVQTLIAVVAVVVYERRMKPHLRGYRPVAKLLSFKVILILEAFQSTIFKILRSSGVFTPTYHISVYDFSVGIPAFILCVEIMLFAVFFWWSFSFSPYRKLAADGYKTLGIFRGMWDCVYIMDIVYGILYLFKALVPGTFGRKYVQRTEDSAERQGTKSHVTPIHSGSESEPDSLQRSSAPVRATEKV